MTNQHPNETHPTPAATIGSVGDLLAAIPALLGFYPARSVVLLALDDVTGFFGATARTDLTLTAAGALRDDAREYIGEAVGMLRRQGADRIFCVLVDDRPLQRAVPALLAAVDAAGRSREAAKPDIEIIDVIFTDRLAAGERWVCRHGESGVVPDPATSAAMLAAVVDGRTVHGSRAALTDQVAHEGPGITMDDCLDAAVEEADGDPRALLGALVAAVTTRRPGPLTDDEVALLGGALLDMRVRDAAMALGLTVRADAARALFAELARRLRGTPRAAAATLVAVCTYLRGEGPLTGIALEAALEADGRYRGAHLLAQALGAGMHPRELYVTAELGTSLARRLGIELPPRDDEEFPLAG